MRPSQRSGDAVDSARPLATPAHVTLKFDRTRSSGHHGQRSRGF